MSYTFDFNKPAFGTFAKSIEVRANFNALAVNHAGDTEPLQKAEGMLWFDTNERRLKCYMNKNDGLGLRWCHLIDSEDDITQPISFSDGSVIKQVKNDTTTTIAQCDVVVWDVYDEYSVKLTDQFGHSPVAGVALTDIMPDGEGLMMIYGECMAHVDGTPIEIYPGVFTNAINNGDELGTSAEFGYAAKKGRSSYYFGISLENINNHTTAKIFVNCM